MLSPVGQMLHLGYVPGFATGGDVGVVATANATSDETIQKRIINIVFRLLFDLLGVIRKKMKRSTTTKFIGVFVCLLQ
jgi:hypothetical protein